MPTCSPYESQRGLCDIREMRAVDIESTLRQLDKLRGSRQISDWEDQGERLRQLLQQADQLTNKFNTPSTELSNGTTYHAWLQRIAAASGTGLQLLAHYMQAASQLQSTAAAQTVGRVCTTLNKVVDRTPASIYDENPARNLAKQLIETGL